MLTDDELSEIYSKVYRGKNPSPHAFAHAVQAATLATVTPLVQQLVDGLEYHMLQTRPITKTEKLLAEARAFLAVAKKDPS